MSGKVTCCLPKISCASSLSASAAPSTFLGTLLPVELLSDSDEDDAEREDAGNLLSSFSLSASALLAAPLAETALARAVELAVGAARRENVLRPLAAAGLPDVVDLFGKEAVDCDEFAVCARDEAERVAGIAERTAGGAPFNTVATDFLYCVVSTDKPVALGSIAIFFRGFKPTAEAEVLPAWDWGRGWPRRAAVLAVVRDDVVDSESLADTTGRAGRNGALCAVR